MKKINELIPIEENNGKKAVNARYLHAFLESKQEFANWIKNRITKYDLVENVDYVTFDNFIKREGTNLKSSMLFRLMPPKSCQWSKATRKENRLDVTL